MRFIKLIIAAIKGQNSKSVFCDVVNSSPELLTRIDEHRELMLAVEKHTDLLVRKPWFKRERSEFCVTLKILQRHHIIQSPFKING
ncbi:Uncharacterised protein [Klebsiella pneumoniae]|nr:Uncharacterised protein [Klebsiella pneumoniae]